MAASRGVRITDRVPRIVTPRRPAAWLGAAVGILMWSAVACGGGTDGASNQPDDLVAVVASYDLVVDRPSRFMVGLYSADQSRVLAFGAVSLTFTFLGTGTETDAGAGPPPGPALATFLPIPGQDIDATITEPQLVAGSEATGVYSAPGVAFSQAGFWNVKVETEVDGEPHHATAAFEVLERSAIPTVGDPAPRTRQPLAGDPEVDPRAIDSRAGTDRPLPDPELHDITIADAIATGRPAMVVVSTPTFCVSRFCGPITDSVHELALRFGDRMAFIHLEVWQDFEANLVNPAAAEWIAPTPDTDAAEPWVFVINGNGIIVQRFDNVASEAELLAAVEAVLGEG